MQKLRRKAILTKSWGFCYKSGSWGWRGRNGGGREGPANIHCRHSAASNDRFDEEQRLRWEKHSPAHLLQGEEANLAGRGKSELGAAKSRGMPGQTLHPWDREGNGLERGL